MIHKRVEYSPTCDKCRRLFRPDVSHALAEDTLTRHLRNDCDGKASVWTWITGRTRTLVERYDETGERIN
jgi:hypothetical protein